MKETRVFSERSQRSFDLQIDLELQVSHLDSQISRYEKTIEDLKLYKANALQKITKPTPSSFDQSALGECVDKLRKDSQALEVLKQHRAALQKQISELAPKPKQIESRSDIQRKIVQIADERFAQDRLAQEALNALRGILQRRTELTAALAEAASSIDFTFERNGLDQQRFDALAESLPQEVAMSSEAWCEWVNGSRANTNPFIVRDECLIIPETLAHSGVYRFGDTIELTENEARDLLQEDRKPWDRESERWRCAPPSIVTFEQHKAALAEAKENNVDIREVYFWQDVAREAQMDTIKRRQLAENYEIRNARFGKTVKCVAEPSIQVKAKNDNVGGVNKGGFLNLTKAGAFQLIDVHAVERPW